MRLLNYCPSHWHDILQKLEIRILKSLHILCCPIPSLCRFLQFWRPEHYLRLFSIFGFSLTFAKSLTIWVQLFFSLFNFLFVCKDGKILVCCFKAQLQLCGFYFYFQLLKLFTFNLLFPMDMNWAKVV